MPDCAVEIGMQLGQRAVGIIRHHMRQIALRQCGQTSADGVDRHLSLAIALLLCFRPLLVGREQGLETLQCLCKLADFITAVSARNFDMQIAIRSEEHTSELQSLMRISYAVFCLKKKTTNTTTQSHIYKDKSIHK